MSEPMAYCQFGAVADRNDDPSVEEAKKKLHDMVVEALGDKRTSGISWTFHAPEEVVGILNELGVFGPERDGLERYLADNPHGMMIVARADCEADAWGPNLVEVVDGSKYL